MKKLFLIAAALFMMSMAPAQISAQTEANNSRPQMRQGRGGRGGFDPAKMLEARIKRMAEQYQLTEDQQKELKALFEEQAKNFQRGNNGRRRGEGNIKREKLTKEQRDSLKTAMEKQRTDLETKLKKILGDEKYAQYQKDEKARMEEMRKRMEQRRQNGGGGFGGGENGNFPPRDDD
ncbi:MAG: DUF4890 domain-containing protein [Bacteroidaceae bacterium]|nr:DUF4890 domain-containing protein [Bacteroidaceae bacterium]